MTTLRFSAVDYLHKLKLVGFNERQAEELVKLREEIEFKLNLDSVSTKQDILNTERSIIRYVTGLIIAQMGVIIGIMLGIVQMFK